MLYDETPRKDYIMLKFNKKNANITHTAIALPDTEKQKAVKVIKKQLIIGAAAVTAIATAAVVAAKVLDVDAATSEN